MKQSQLVANNWPRPRTIVPWKLEQLGDKPGSILMGVQMFLDRWLVAVYSRGPVYLYDTQPTPPNHRAPAILRSYLDLKDGVCNSYTISLDSMANKLVLAVSSWFNTWVLSFCFLSTSNLFSDFRPYWIHIYEVQLTELSSHNDIVPGAFKIIRAVTSLTSKKAVRALNTKERIVALSNSRSNAVELVKLDEDFILDRRFIIALQPEDNDDLVSNDRFLCFHFSYSIY